MSFKRKLKKAVKNIIGDLSKIQWKDLDHKKVFMAIAVAVAVIILIIVLIATAVSGDNEEIKQGTEDAAITSEESAEEEVVDENPLEVDAYDEINTLVLKYFHGLSTGDIPLVEDVVDVLTDEEKATIEKKKDYIESYNSITCYTKKGLEENSYVVFASYEMKIYNIEIPAPGIMALYVCTGEDGDLYIYNGEAPEELTNYVLELAAEEDVAAVIADVDARYQQLIEEDEDLGKFAQTMLESQQAEAEGEEPEEPVDEETELDEPITTTVTDNIRIREERSTDSNMLGTLAAGTEVKVYANYSDGWSKIEYSGLVGYCKTEFLESTEGVPSADEEAEEDAADSEETEDNTSEETEATTVNKKMQFKETVRIRAERSTDSERLANGYTKEIVTVLENYSDGWSKIDYNGTIGYCKTEFLEEAQ